MGPEERAAQQFGFLGCCAMDLLHQGQQGRLGAIRIGTSSPEGIGEVTLVSMDSAVWLNHVRPFMQKLGLPLAEQNPPR